jgi:hypothetical protein
MYIEAKKDLGQQWLSCIYTSTKEDVGQIIDDWENEWKTQYQRQSSQNHNCQRTIQRKKATKKNMNTNKEKEMIQVDIGGHPPIPTGSSCHFLVQHVLLYFFVIVGSTLLGLSEALHIFQVDIGGLSPNPTGLFCMFSCQHILLYFQGHFGALNNVFLARHSQTIDKSEFDGVMCISLKYLSNGLSRT